MTDSKFPLADWIDQQSVEAEMDDLPDSAKAFDETSALLRQLHAVLKENAECMRLIVDQNNGENLCLDDRNCLLEMIEDAEAVLARTRGETS